MSSRETWALWRTALALSRRQPARKAGGRLPPLLLFTDPDRTPDVLAAAARLPGGAGVVFRHFGRPDLLAQAPALARLTRSRRLVLLVGDDPGLAERLGAQGVHLPERRTHEAPALRRRRPDWLITTAAHSPAALRRAAVAGADAAVLSPVFPSRSPSATRPLGQMRAAAMARDTPLPVYALGGVSSATALRLRSTTFSGVAAVEALA